MVNGKKLSEKKKALAIKTLALGHTVQEAEKLSGINHCTINEELSRQAETIKKEIQKEFAEDTAADINQLAKDMLSVIKSAVKSLTPGKVESQSGAAIATTMGILVDKMQLLTGGATENVQISAGPKSEDFLQKLRAKSKRNESANSEKIINITPITETQNKETP